MLTAKNGSRFLLDELIHSNRWQPLCPGVDALCLVGGVGKAGSAALLRYDAGAHLQRHRHHGLEQILVLSGSQADEHGTYGPGSLVFNETGSAHSVSSAGGCVVLVTWHGTVTFEPSAT